MYMFPVCPLISWTRRLLTFTTTRRTQNQFSMHYSKHDGESNDEVDLRFEKLNNCCTTKTKENTFICKVLKTHFSKSKNEINVKKMKKRGRNVAQLLLLLLGIGIVKEWNNLYSLFCFCSFITIYVCWHNDNNVS